MKILFLTRGRCTSTLNFLFSPKKVYELMGFSGGFGELKLGG